MPQILLVSICIIALAIPTCSFSPAGILFGARNAKARDHLLNKAATRKQSIIPDDTPSSLPLRQEIETRDGDLDIKWPNFERVFEKIQQVSPLAKSVMSGENYNLGLEAISDDTEELKWKTIHSNKKQSLHKIERIDNYDDIHHAPLLRFRCSLEGPCLVELQNGRKLNTGLYFTRYIVDQEFRSKWDSQMKQVSEPYTFCDLEFVNSVLGLDEFGVCRHFGIGYVETKQKFGIGAREQLFVYGLQDFDDGSCIVWGTELDESNNHLFPDTGKKRLTRSKNHLFSVCVTPKTKDTFDVEYVVQMEIGGGLPVFLTTPVLINLIKRLLGVIEKEFAEGEGGSLDRYLKQMTDEAESSSITSSEVST